MAAQPRFPQVAFNPRAWLTDTAVGALTLGEQGLYLRLLCFCWLDGVRAATREPYDGTLPGDLKCLAALVGLPEAAFRAVWPNVAPHFVLADGRYTHRVERDDRLLGRG